MHVQVQRLLANVDECVASETRNAGTGRAAAGGGGGGSFSPASNPAWTSVANVASIGEGGRRGVILPQDPEMQQVRTHSTQTQTTTQATTSQTQTSNHSNTTTTSPRQTSKK